MYTVEWHSTLKTVASTFWKKLLKRMKRLYVGTPGPRPTKASWADWPGEFGTGWLGTAGQALKFWPGPAAEFNISYIYCFLLFLESRVSTSPFYL